MVLMPMRIDPAASWRSRHIPADRNNQPESATSPGT
jgi:hypothetical protein